MPMPSPSMGQAPIEAKRQQQAVIGKGIDMVGQMMENYAQSRKQIDVEADEATFKVFAKKRMANADFAARNATDPKEIDRIYSSAQNDIRQYIDGDTGGTPNIRWKDHQRDITNRFVQLSGDIEIATAEKKFELYDRDTIAKAEMLQAYAIENGDEDALMKAADIFGVGKTQAEKDLFIADGLSKISQYKEKRQYEGLQFYMRDLELQYERGDITSQDKVDGLKGAMKNANNLPEKYQASAKGEAVAKLTKAYREEKADVRKRLVQIARGLEDGSYTEEDVRYFMKGRVKDYDDLQIVASEARETIEESPDSGIAILNAVDSAMKGYTEKDGKKKPYYIDDAIKDMKDSSSMLGPLGLIVLGAAMSDSKTGADDEEFYNTWTVPSPSYTEGASWIQKRDPIKVPKSPDTILSRGMSDMGVYMASGVAESKWARNTMESLLKLHINEAGLKPREIEEEYNKLFQGKALDIVRGISAPQTKETTTTPQSDPLGLF